MNLRGLKMVGFTKTAGFTLLPVVLAMSLIAAIAFLLNRDNGMNANMVAGQMDKDRARYAAEAGLQAANAKVQSLSCAGGFPVAGNPLTNSNFGGASYTAYATTASGDTTNLVATGTYNGTSVRLTRSNIYVYQSASKTYTLQPNAAAGLDTYIDSASAATNHHAASTLLLSQTKNMLFKFDLSAFPAGSRPISAIFSIKQNGALLSYTSFYRMTSDWEEGTGAISPLDGATWDTKNGSTTWLTAGGDYHAHKLNNSTVTNVYGSWADFDATAVIAAWLSGQYPNYGVMVKSDTSNSPSFISSDSTTSADRPKITFNYMLPCGTMGPVDTPHGTITLNPIADSFNDTNTTSQFNNGASTALKLYNGASLENRILSQFDTSSIPAGATISSAKLRMYVSGVSNITANTKSIWVNAVNESWVEGAGNNTSKACPTATAGTSWSYRTNCTSWASNLHPPFTLQSWTAMAPIPTARTNHMLATVNNKIYVIGGYNPVGGYFKTVEEYDPATNSWTTKTNMPTARAGAAVAVVSGKIYVIGGTSNGNSALKTNEMYDPAANTWTSKATMPTARMYLAATAVNNKIYALGGKSSLLILKTNEMYDPVANTWSAKTSMPTSRTYLSTQAVNGKIYAIGGWTGLLSLNNNEVYDPIANNWANKASLPTGTDSMASAVLGNKIYLIGGIQGATLTNAVAMYDTLNNTYTAQLNYPIAIDVPAAAVANGYIYSMGGDDYASIIYPNNYKFDPGIPTPIDTATDESTSASPLAAGFTSGWINFELKPLVQEWVDGVRPNNGVVIYTEVPDQFSINSRENTTTISGNATKPQLIVEY